MTAMQHKPHDPTAHLSAEDVETLGREVVAICGQIAGSRGECAAEYTRLVIGRRRGIGLASRAVLVVSLFPPAWLDGTGRLLVSKIVGKMGIGDKVLHG